MPNISKQDVKPALKFLISLDNHEDLRLSIETSKRKLHNFSQISVNDFHNLNLNFRNLRLSACLNLDD